MTRLIGLTGPAQSGKDTVARVLREHGFQRVAFADPIRDSLYNLNPLVFDDSTLVLRRLKSIVDDLGWDQAKVRYPEIRSLMQRFGTEVARDLYGDDFWIVQAFRKIDKIRAEGESVVITDVRFENEARAIIEAGGEVWGIVRPGVGPVNDHKSDAGLHDGFMTCKIINDGDLNDLAGKAGCALDKLPVPLVY